MNNQIIIKDGSDLMKSCFDFIDSVVDSTQEGSIFHAPGLALLKEILRFKHASLTMVRDGLTDEVRIYSGMDRQA